MRFCADLHIHSRFSRATSKDCNLEQLALWAQRKGLSVLGTGDFTHPAWFAEIHEKLVPAEAGLFRLRPDLEDAVEKRLSNLGRPAAARSSPVRFILQVEISTIYKKGERTRKVHHLIYAPDLEKAETITSKLARIGNVRSDGRPILGLDSRHLLEIALESGEGCFLIPAHIWTPWFSVLGAQSGFDAIDECYDDLSTHIFAVETGLSSDPPMNWRLSGLDRYRLVSNSDAHSPANLGREACVFDAELSFFAMRAALVTGRGYCGTAEFFPEEGKYHLDGHRKCNTRLSPEQTKQNGGRCPACGKPVTVGVMHRVTELADRPEGARPVGAGAFRSLIPLPEILGQILRVGSASVRVRKAYDALLSRLGPELFVLERAPLDDVRQAGGAVCAEAIRRMREGRVIREAGYDGEYGVIRLFEEGELRGEEKTGEFPFEEAPPSPRPSSAPGSDRAKTASAAARGRTAASQSCAHSQSLHGGRGGPRPSSAPFVARLGDLSPTGGAPSSATAEQGSKMTRRCVASPIRGESVPDAGEVGERGEGAPLWASDGGRRPVAVRDSSPEASTALSSLDPDQRAAAEFTDGPLLIVAGPGTGKTRTLTHRIAHLVADRGVAPEQCLAITFTRRAAGEMRERLRGLLPGRWGKSRS